MGNRMFNIPRELLASKLEPSCTNAHLALEVVRMIYGSRIVPCESGVKERVLTLEEDDCLHSALSYLQRRFEKGDEPQEVHLYVHANGQVTAGGMFAARPSCDEDDDE